MLERKWKRLLDNREWLPVALLLILGCALRLAGLGSLPWGLNQDEASAGYETFALLSDGMDRCGNSWPVLFVSWGSGQNALMSYLALPFVAALGLTETAVRLPNALSGCLTLVVFWLLARRARGRAFGVTALGLLALNPWHIMMSRWALESNLLPAFLMLGLWLCSLAREKPWALAGAAASFGVMLYAYGTAFFFLPLFLVGAVLWLRKHLEWKSFLTSLLLFVLLALPIALCQLRNALGLDSCSLLGVTLPRLTEGRQAATSVLGGGGWAAAGENLRSLLHMLWYQSDGLSYNALPLLKGGLLYVFGLPTAILGLAVFFRRRRETDADAPVLIALAAALVCGVLIQGNVNRLNMLWLPLVYFSALGCHELFARLREWAVLPLAGAVLCFGLFWSAYTQRFGEEGNPNYFPGLGAAVEYAESLDPESIYITDYVNAPYIFALFYTETDPALFRETVDYPWEDAAFRPVDSFGHYRFTDRGREEAEVLILHRNETEGREVLAVFGHYAVCR